MCPFLGPVSEESGSTYTKYIKWTQLMALKISVSSSFGITCCTQTSAIYPIKQNMQCREVISDRINKHSRKCFLPHIPIAGRWYTNAKYYIKIVFYKLVRKQSKLTSSSISRHINAVLHRKWTFDWLTSVKIWSPTYNISSPCISRDFSTIWALPPEYKPPKYPIKRRVISQPHPEKNLVYIRKDTWTEQKQDNQGCMI